MKKRSPVEIILFSLLLVCGLIILRYSFIRETSVERTLMLVLIIVVLICLLVRFYLKNLELARSGYQKLFNGSPLAIYIMDKKTLKILEVNEAMIKLYGYTEKEFQKMTALDIRPPESHDSFIAYVLKPDKLPDESGVALHQKKNGEQFHVKFNFHAVPQVRADAVLVMLTDIDMALKDKKRIDELIHLYEIVNKATNDVIWEYDLQEDKLYWMQGFEETYGYAKEDNPYDFWTMKNVYHEDREDTIQYFLDIIINKKREWLTEYRYTCADGTLKYVRDRGLMLFNDTGKPIRMVGAMQNIDKQRKYEQQLLNQNKQLKEIAWINSHELRRPLSNILALSRLIKDSADQPEDIKIMIDLLYESSTALDNAVTLINKQTIDGKIES